MKHFLLALIILLPLIAFSQKSGAKTVEVCVFGYCVPIKLPARGECIYENIQGYKVRICL